MAEQHRLSGFEFGFGSAGQRGGAAPKRDPGDAMRILVMGDFSGRANRGVVEAGDALARREVHGVDVDELDGVMARVGAALMDPLAPAGHALPLEFRSLEAFHPDRLLTRVEAFSKVRQVRERLRNRATFDSAAAELVALLGFDPAGAVGASKGAASAPPGARSGAEEFAALLGGEVRAPSAQKPGGFDVESFVRGVVQQHVVQGPDARERAYLAATDAALSALMQRLMHTPDFQALEAAWRGVQRLITTLETGEELSVHVLDVSRQEVMTDIAAAARAGGIGASGLHRRLVDASVGSVGAGQWGVIVGCYSFTRTVQDAVLLSGISQLAAAAGAPFLAGADSALVGCASFADGADPEHWAIPSDAAATAAGQAWEMLRATEESRHVALAMPRVLVRVPYGTGGEAADAFGFEELPAAPAGANASTDRARHEAYLWGNPAFAMAEVLGRAFASDSWSLDAGAADDVMDLPVHSFNEGPGQSGPKRVTPCAEAWLTERGAAVLRQAGITPLQSIKGRDGVRVSGILSLHESGEALSGRWG